MAEEHLNYIDGSWLKAKSGETFQVHNPADPSAVVGEFQASSPADAEMAVNAAVAAKDEWADTPGPDRGAVLLEASRLLEDHKKELTEGFVAEEGKTWAEASGEVQRAIDIFSYYAAKSSDLGGTVKSASSRRTELSTRLEPLGVVSLITPWNYPIAIPAWKMAPALAAGNTVVFKPASVAPGVSKRMVELLEEAGIPDGVVNYITGSGSDVGSTIVEHESVDGVSFTGSTSVGTHLAKSAMQDLTRVQCEMGGKNPTVVMPSADMREAAETIGVGGFGTTGQSCTATSRAIVHTDVYETFVEEMVRYAESLDVGPGMEKSDMGPQVSKSELESTLEYIDIGITEGATLETGGEQLSGAMYGDGYFIQPTVFSDVENSSRLAQEEIFGPVIAVIEAADFDEAMQLANDVEYGLSSSIMTQDLTEANEFIRDIEAGVAKVNEKTTGLELHVPFGGYKDSSTNTYREQGDAGLDFFTSTKTVYRNF